MVNFWALLNFSDNLFLNGLQPHFSLVNFDMRTYEIPINMVHVFICCCMSCMFIATGSRNKGATTIHQQASKSFCASSSLAAKDWLLINRFLRTKTVLAILAVSVQIIGDYPEKPREKQSV